MKKYIREPLPLPFLFYLLSGSPVILGKDKRCAFLHTSNIKNGGLISESGRISMKTKIVSSFFLPLLLKYTLHTPRPII